MFFEGPVLFPFVVFVAGEQDFSSALGCFLGSFLLPNGINEHHFNPGEQSAWLLFSLCVFQSPGCNQLGPGALALHCCLTKWYTAVCCLSCPVCMEAMYCRSAMPCVPDCWGAISHHHLQTNPIGTFISLSGFTYPGTSIRLEAGQRM